MANRSVSLSVDCTTDAELATTWETLARLAAGLQIEGIEARLYGYTLQEEGDSP